MGNIPLNMNDFEDGIHSPEKHFAYEYLINRVIFNIVKADTNWNNSDYNYKIQNQTLHIKNSPFK